MTLGSVSSRLRKYEKISLNKRTSSHDGIKDLNEIPTYMYISMQKMSLERLIDQITCKFICNLISLEKSCPSSCIHQKEAGQPTWLMQEFRSLIILREQSRSKRRNSILMTRQYPDLGSASHWVKQIFNQSEALSRSR